MAIRIVRLDGDPILRKKAKPVKELTPRLKQLIEDMKDTMREEMGVGLAAPQVGVLKRIVVVDIGEGPVVLINPEIIWADGSQTGDEGCLSLPGKIGVVTRPEQVRVRAWNEAMEEFEIEGEALLARALCHELDHLEGVLYKDLAEGELRDIDYDELAEEEEGEEEA